MSDAASAEYPREGHDWIDPAILSYAAARNAAMLEEQFTCELAGVRKLFFSKMMAHRALENGYGWAIFCDEAPGTTAELGAREVLLKSNTVIGQSRVDHLIPTIRIITNEPFMQDGYNDFLTEDLTILPSGLAAYYMTAVKMKEYDAGQQEGALKTSEAHLFFTIGGQLAITNNAKDTTPVKTVNCDLDEKVITMPFGEPSRLSDQFYVLEKARSILGSIANLVPEYQMET